jgi:transposase
MPSGTAFNDSCRPDHHRGNFAATACVASSTRSFICYARAAPGAVSPPISRPGKQSIITLYQICRGSCRKRRRNPGFKGYRLTPSYNHPNQLGIRQFCRTGLWTHLYRELRVAERRRAGKDPHPSAAIMDAQSVKTVEESAHISGFDAHECIKGRKRHLLVDTLGLPIALYVTPADMHDTQGARQLLAGLKYFVPRLKKIWADAAYRGKELADWCKAQGDWDLEVVERTPGMHGFAVLPKRWIVERTFAWLSHNRRLSKSSYAAVKPAPPAGQGR